MRPTQSPQYCLRCKTIELAMLPESTEEATFYECPGCHRHFALISGRGLCERWLGPLSLVLYGIIFERRPQDASRRIAELFLAQSRREEIVWMRAEIAQEIEQPTQNVCDIHDLRQKEEDVRAFLRLVVDYWDEALKSQPGVGEGRA